MATALNFLTAYWPVLAAVVVIAVWRRNEIMARLRPAPSTLNAKPPAEALPVDFALEYRQMRLRMLKARNEHLQQIEAIEMALLEDEALAPNLQPPASPE